MYPFLHLLDGQVSTYALLAMAGLFAGGIFTACYSGPRRGYNWYDTILTLIIAACGSLICGPGLYAITNIPSLIAFLNAGVSHTFPEILSFLAFMFGGSVFLGGLLGGFLAAILFLRKKKRDVGAFADAAAPAIPLFHCFGRIGCFLSGCCYGIEWEHGFVFTDSLARGANGVPRFPVQLVEAGCNLLLFAVLFFLFRKMVLYRNLIWVYVASYAVIRFTLEFFRGDVYRGALGPFSTSQWICIGMILATLIRVVAGIAKHRRNPEPDISVRQKTKEDAL